MTNRLANADDERVYQQQSVVECNLCLAKAPRKQRKTVSGLTTTIVMTLVSLCIDFLNGNNKEATVYNK